VRYEKGEGVPFFLAFNTDHTMSRTLASIETCSAEDFEMALTKVIPEATSPLRLSQKAAVNAALITKSYILEGARTLQLPSLRSPGATTDTSPLDLRSALAPLRAFKAFGDSVRMSLDAVASSLMASAVGVGSVAMEALRRGVSEGPGWLVSNRGELAAAAALATPMYYLYADRLESTEAAAVTLAEERHEDAGRRGNDAA
jgi:hypothetical protein